MLTDRELEVRRLRKAGKTQAEIARILKISQPAVSAFERNADRKVAQAQDLVEQLKKLGLLAFAFFTLSFLAHGATALTIPSPGHPAYETGPGTNGSFYPGNYSFPGVVNVTSTLNVTGSATVQTILYTPQLCLNGTCQTSWPSGSGNVTSANGTSGYIPYFTNSTNTNTSGLYYDSPNKRVGLGTASPTGQIDVVMPSGGSGTVAIRVTDPSATPVGIGLYAAATHSSGTGIYATGGLYAANFASDVVVSGGKLAVNSTTLTYSLNVIGSANVSTTLYTSQLCLNNACYTGTLGNLSSGNGTSGYLARFTNSTNANTGSLYDNGTGGIGISTTSPSYPLDVRTSINGADVAGFTSGSGAGFFVRSIGASQSNYLALTATNGVDLITITPASGCCTSGSISSPQGNVLNFISSSANPLSIDSYGQVFVNGTSPNVLRNALTVTGNANISAILYSPQICLNGDCRTAWPAVGGGNTSSANGSSGYVPYFTNNTNINTSSLYYDVANNRIGVGTPSPSTRLHVEGVAYGSGNIALFQMNGYPATIEVKETYGNAAANVGILLTTTNGGSYTIGSHSGGYYYITTPTLTNAFVVTNGGFAGINTTVPKATLDVNGTFVVRNSSGVALINVTTGNFVRFGTTTSNVSIMVNGSVNVTGAVTQNSGFDVAEMFSAQETMEAGDLVIATSRDTVAKATKADADLVIGAVSTQPGFILANPNLANPTLIGLSGRIPVKVTGTVSRGDFITVSDTPGIGERATSAGFVIGRALEDAVGGRVMIIIQPYYFNPSVAADGTLVGGAAEKPIFEDISAVAETVKSGDFGASAQGGVKTGDDVVVALGAASSDVVVTLG